MKIFWAIITYNEIARKMEILKISKKFRRYAAERVGLRPIWLAHGHPPPFWPHGGGQIVKIFGLYTEAESHPA